MGSPLLKLILKPKPTPGTAIMATMDTMVTTVPMDTMDMEESMDKWDHISKQFPEYDSPRTKTSVSIVQYLGLSNRIKGLVIVFLLEIYWPAPRLSTDHSG